MLALALSAQNSCVWAHGGQEFVFACPKASQCGALSVGFVAAANSCIAFPDTPEHFSACNALCWTGCVASTRAGNVRVRVDGEYLRDLWEADERRAVVVTSVACGGVIVGAFMIGVVWRLVGY